MTFKEKLTLEHPEALNNYCYNNIEGCPSDYGYSKEEEVCPASNCVDCWNREIKKEVRKMNKFTLENKIIVVKEFWCDEKYTIRNLITPSMELDISEFSLLKDIQIAMENKVANTILETILHKKISKINSLPVLNILFEKLDIEIKNNLVKITRGTEINQWSVEKFPYNKLQKENEDVYLLLTNIFTNKEIELMSRTCSIITTFKINGMLKEYAKIDRLLDPLFKESLPTIYKRWEAYVQKEIDKIKEILETDMKIQFLQGEENIFIEFKDLDFIK